MFYTNMKINLQKSINFGYDILYHQEIQQKIKNSSGDDEEKNALLQDDQALILREEELIAAEQIYLNKSRAESYALKSRLLVHDKYDHASRMNDYFEDTSYSKSLAQQYLKESKIPYLTEACKKWRFDLYTKLSELDLTVENIIDNPVDANEILEADKAQQLKAQQIKAQLQQSSVAPKIPMFVDTRNTPKEIGPTTFEIEEAQKHNLTLHKITKSSPKGLDDVVGMDELKQSFQEDIIDYINNPEQAKLDEEEYGIRAPRGFLLFGPPGCGKTFITEALAAQCDFRMYKMNVSQICEKWINASASNLEKAFEFLYKTAKDKNKPILLFMDEVDALAKDRSKQSSSHAEDMKVLTTLLKHIEAARDNNIIIFAATNKYDLLDDAFISRFDRTKYIGLPDIIQIEALVKNYLSKRSKGHELSQDNKSIEEIAKQMSGYSNRSIVFILDEACKIAKRDNRSKIMPKHIIEAIKTSDLQKIDEIEYKKDKDNSKKIGFITD